MKNILFLIILISGSAYSQDKRFSNLYDNFTVDNGKIVWQKVFETELSPDEIITKLEKNIIFSPIAQSLKGHTNVFKLTKCITYGIMPGYERSDFQAYVDFEIKEGRYRVTVTDIKMDFTSEVYSSKTYTFTNLENYQITNEGKFSNKTQAKKGLNCVNLTFLDLFDFKKSELKKDW